MKRIGIRCKQCESTYDVTGFEPGSQVQCGVCSALLTVPDAARVAAEKTRRAAAQSAEPAPAAPAAPAAPPPPAAPRAPLAPAPVAPAAPVARAPKRTAASPRRATTARRSQEVSGRRGDTRNVGTRASTTRRVMSRTDSGRQEPLGEGEEEAPRYQRTESKAGLYASLGAVVVTLIIGGLYASGILAPTDKGGSSQDQPVVPKTSQWDDHAKQQFEVKYQEMVTNLEANVSEENVEKSAENCATCAKWVQDSVLDNREALGVPEGDLVIWTARRDELAERALSYDKDNRPAHLMLEHILFELDKASAEEWHKFFPVDREILQPLIEVDHWLSAEEHAEKKELERAALARVASAPGSGAFIENANMVLGNFKNLKILKELTWEYQLSERDDGASGHFLIFSEKEAGKEINEDLLRRARILEREYDFLEREYFAPVGLERDESDPLVVVALKDRESYKAFTKEYYDAKMAAQTLGHYNPKTGYFVYYEGISPVQGISDDEVMLHEGAHQIEAAFCDKPHDPDSKRRPIWRVEGWADYIGSFSPDDIDKKSYWEFARPGASRLGMLTVARQGVAPGQRVARGAKGKSLLLPVKMLLGVMQRSSMLDLVLEQLPQEVRTGLRDNPQFAGFVENLMYAQGCTFCNFAYAFEGGKYRKAFQEYMQATFTGKCNTARRSRRVLSEKFGFDYEDKDAWNKLNDEYLEYLTSVNVR